MTTSSLPTSCDYLVVGAGATGVAFTDSLIQGLRLQQQSADNDGNDVSGSKDKIATIVLIDQHSAPGGQWNDSYDFVRLHQPSAMYGVESALLEPDATQKDHRATRQEILDYYGKLVKSWEQSDQDLPVKFRFIGKASLEFPFQVDDQDIQGPSSYKIQIQTSGVGSDSPATAQSHSISVTKRLVDARYLQPDLPVSTPAKFQYDPAKIRCVPVNEIAQPRQQAESDASSSNDQYFVIIGAGKTGMDAVVYLLTQRKIPASNIFWIAPHDPWITARENIGNCLEFLHDATQIYANQTELPDLKSTAVVQKTFLKWEEQGKIYRLFPSAKDDLDSLPTKFNDATLCKEELELLRSIGPKQILRGQGRVTNIDSETGDLVLQDGNRVSLPWISAATPDRVKDTTYVHCSAGAFHYTKLNGLPPAPVFDPKRKCITIQDVYGTPGFCFVGSFLGKLESLSLDDAQKNALCNVPPPPPETNNQGLGPSGGTVAGLSKDHGFVQRLCNVRKWLETPPLRNWLVGHRLFNLGHYASAEDMDQLVSETWAVLKENQLVHDDN